VINRKKSDILQAKKTAMPTF